MLLQVNNISKKYGSQQVLNKVSFEIQRGEIVGFLGPNGAGKSTTMKIITGCIQANEGHVIIAGHDISKEPVTAKSHIGYLPENNPLYKEMYVAEYLQYVVSLYKKNTHAKIKDIVAETIRQTGLSPESHKKIIQLSKGYRQRVGLAQAIIHNPEILILDEPTSGLDPNQIDEVNNLLQFQSKEKAILFSTHTLSEIASICTRIIIIHKGNIVADMPFQEVNNLRSLFKDLTKS